MSKRRDALRAMMEPISEAASNEPSQKPTAKSSAVRSMGLVLQQLSSDAGLANRLSEVPVAGEVVQKLDASLLDPSIVRDRMEGWVDGEAFQNLIESLSVHGQMVPVLVRPHPDLQGRFQIAYGHRRVEALKRLGKPVQGVVRDLTDEDLVVAQAKENLDREELTFIEIATFAHRLAERGLSRALVGSALGLERTTLSRMISLVETLPAELLNAVGPAGKIGRPRWEEMQDIVSKSGDAWRGALGPRLESLNSEDRFLSVLNSLKGRKARAPSESIRVDDGRVIAKVARVKGDLRLVISGKTDPEFGDYLAERLPDLYSSFKAGN